MDKSLKGQVRSNIIFENADLIILNKPAGVAMHPINLSDETETIASILKDKLANNDTIRGGIVHRLDKDTSGVVVLAKNNKSLGFLQEQFSSRKVEKTYIALVWGHLKYPQARLELPIKRSNKAPNKMSIDASGKMAISEYKVTHSYKNYSLLELKILTGRTHQIRVQLAHLGHPVVGDKLYGNKPTPVGLNRQFLHANKIAIKLSQNSSKNTFEAPLAQDLKYFLDKLDE